jgi:hypothetical protein
MRRFALMAVAALMLVPVSACDDDTPTNPATAPVVFDVQMRGGANETPAVTNAEAGVTGNAVVRFDVPRDSSGAVTGGGTANFQVALTGFPAGSSYTLGHIHVGAQGIGPGPVLVSMNLSLTAINGGTTTINVDVPIAQALAQQVMDNPAGHYVNIHSQANPIGVARGQMVRR